MMRTETIGDYEIECSAVQLPGSDGWEAWLAIYGPSANPMHRNSIFPNQRVSVETVFPTEEEAEAAAREVAITMVEPNKASH